MQVHDAGHVETNTEHEQQQHQHPPERDQSEKSCPIFPLTAVKTPSFLIIPGKINPITLNTSEQTADVEECVYLLWNH